MKVFKLLSILLILSIITSCGSLRNKSKSKEISEVEQSVRIEKKEEENTAIKEKEVDKGEVITERQVINKTTTGGKSKVTIKKGDLKHGENFIRDSANNVIRAILDSLKQTLYIELELPKTVLEQTINERTTEKKDQTKEREENSSKKIEAVIDSMRREYEFESLNESKPNWWAILINHIGWAIGGVILIGFVLWYFFGRKK